jgi:hypothetical protein
MMEGGVNVNNRTRTTYCDYYYFLFFPELLQLPAAAFSEIRKFRDFFL